MSCNFLVTLYLCWGTLPPLGHGAAPSWRPSSPTATRLRSIRPDGVGRDPRQALLGTARVPLEDWAKDPDFSGHRKPLSAGTSPSSMIFEPRVGSRMRSITPSPDASRVNITCPPRLNRLPLHKARLEAICLAAMQEQRIVAMSIWGSFARGTADWYSDLDLALVSEDDDVRHVIRTAREIAE